MRSLLDMISRCVQSVLFLWVRTDNKPARVDLNALTQATPVVYVLEQQSTADAMVLDHQCRKLGLPDLSRRLGLPGLEGSRPLISIHARRSVLRRHRSGVAPLIQPMLNYLTENPDEDILLVPVALFWAAAHAKAITC